MPQALRITDIALEEITAEILGGVVGDIQVGPHLRITGAIETVTRQAVFLEQRKALVDRVIGRQFRVRQQRRKALRHRLQLLDAGDLERPLLRADMPGLRVGPHQVERACTRLAICQCGPWLGRIFHRQPGACAVVFQQRRSREFGGEPIEGNGLQVALRFHAR